MLQTKRFGTALAAYPNIFPNSLEENPLYIKNILPNI
jgi:hypothetical protein